MEHARTHTRAGQIMNRLLELDFIADRFRIGWDEISAEEVKGLQIIREERDRMRDEANDERARQQEMIILSQKAKAQR